MEAYSGRQPRLIGPWGQDEATEKGPEKLDHIYKFFH